MSHDESKSVPVVKRSEEVSYPQAMVETIIQAVPHIGSSLIMMVGNFVGVVFISKLGTNELAASNLAYSIQNFLMTTVTSSVSAGTNRAAKKIGEGRQIELGGVLQKSWLISLGFSVPIAVIMLGSTPILPLLHQSSSVVQLTSEYFYGFVLGVPAMLMMTSNRQFALAAKNPKVAMAFVLFYQLLDTGLSYCFVFGKGFFPKLGFSGLSYSNSIAVWTAFLSFTAYMGLAPSFREYGITKIHTNQFFHELWEISKSCLSMGSKVSAELGTMVAASLMIGAMGADQQAAQEAAMQYVFIISPLMFGMMDVSMKQVSNAFGAKNLNNIRKYGYSGVLLGIASAILFLGIFLAIPKLLLKLFIDDSDNQLIMNTAKRLLMINGLTQIGDSIRTILLGCLNAMEDRVTPTLYMLLTLFPLFIPLSYVLGFPAHLEAEGVMIARFITIVCGAAMLSGRWFNKTNWENRAFQSGDTTLLSESSEGRPLLAKSGSNNSSYFGSWFSYFSGNKQPSSVQANENELSVNVSDPSLKLG